MCTQSGSQDYTQISKGRSGEYTASPCHGIAVVSQAIAFARVWLARQGIAVAIDSAKRFLCVLSHDYNQQRQARPFPSRSADIAFTESDRRCGTERV